MIEPLVTNQVIGGTETLTGSYEKGHFNGLLFSVSSPDNSAPASRIADAVLKSKFIHDQVEHLAVNIPLTALMEISDFDRGSTGVMAGLFTDPTFLSTVIGADFVQLDPAAALEATKDASPIASQIIRNNVTFYVDFGSIWCDNGNKFEFEVDPGGTGATYSVYTVSNQVEPFHFITYNLDRDLNEVHKNVFRSFLYTEKSNKDFDIYVKSPEKQYDSNNEGFRAYAQVFGQRENFGSGLLYELFKSDYGIPQDVQIKIFNNNEVVPLDEDGSRMMIINQQVYVPKALVTSKNIEILKKAAELARQFEENHPDQAALMSGAGMFTGSSVIEGIAKKYIK